MQITLLADVRACRLCAEHLPLGPRPVVQLHPAARILIAAQAPGRKVHETGIPFDDASGERLRRWLGVTPQQFYDPALFAGIAPGTRAALAPLLREAMQHGRVTGSHYRGRWIDVGTADRLADLDASLRRDGVPR